jgi:hypothetical protein
LGIDRLQIRLGGLDSSRILYHQGNSVVGGSDLDHPFASMDVEPEPIAIIPTKAMNFAVQVENFLLSRRRITATHATLLPRRARIDLYQRFISVSLRSTRKTI